jgi:hypothetical protein
MTAKCPAQRRNGRRLSGRARPLVGLALMAFALLGAPAPVAAAQPAPRSEPTELWRQFPLNAGPSQPVGRSEAQPRSSATATGSTAAGARSLSFSAVQIGAIVATTALVLLLLAGALAHSANGSLGFAIRRRERGLARPFRDFVDTRRADPSAGQQFAIRRWVRRQRKRGAGEVHAMRATAADFSARIASEVGALKVKLHPLSVSTDNESRVIEVGPLERRLEMYSARRQSDRTVDDESESLEAINAHRSPPASDNSSAQVEVETLREKLAVQQTKTDGPHRDDLQALKDKLDVNPAPIKPASMVHSELEILKAKLGSHASLNSERRTVPISDARTRELERTTPPKVPGKLSRGAARRNTTFSSDAPAASNDVQAPAEPPIQSAIDSELPTASSAPALPDRSIHRSRLVVIGAKVLQLALLVIIIALVLLNIAVLFDLGVVS